MRLLPARLGRECGLNGRDVNIFVDPGGKYRTELHAPSLAKMPAPRIAIPEVADMMICAAFSRSGLGVQLKPQTDPDEESPKTWRAPTAADPTFLRASLGINHGRLPQHSTRPAAVSLFFARMDLNGVWKVAWDGSKFLPLRAAS